MNGVTIMTVCWFVYFGLIINLFRWLDNKGPAIVCALIGALGLGLVSISVDFKTVNNYTEFQPNHVEFLTLNAAAEPITIKLPIPKNYIIYNLNPTDDFTIEKVDDLSVEKNKKFYQHRVIKTDYFGILNSDKNYIERF